MTLAEQTRPHSNLLRTIAIAGTVTAVVEMIPVLPIQAALGNSPTIVLQSIASGLLGRAAYAGGVPTALLGAALHLIIALGAAAIFAVAASRFDLLLRRPIAAGLAFGLGAYLFMTYVVLPLSAVAYTPATAWPMVTTSIAIHMLFFGVPIALLVRRSTVRS